MRRGLIEPVHGRSQFARFRRPSGRGSSGPVRVRFVEGAGDGAPGIRVAYAISRRFGTAVARNRARRRLRSAVDQVAPELPAGAYLVLPDPQVGDMAFPVLVGAVRDAMMGAARGGIFPPAPAPGTGGAA